MINFIYFPSQALALMATGAADLVSAFHIELKSNVQIPRRSMVELRNYKTNVSFVVLASHCIASPCIASPCIASPRLALHCIAFPNHSHPNPSTQVGQYGTFVRGEDIDFRSGQFTVPYTAIYRFSAGINIMRNREANLRPRDVVKVLICIEFQCDRNT